MNNITPDKNQEKAVQCTMMQRDDTSTNNYPKNITCHVNTTLNVQEGLKRIDKMKGRQ